MNTVAHTNKRLLTLEDLRRFDTVSSASVSPDGLYLVFVKTKVSWEENIRRDLINILELKSGTLIKEFEGSAPQWSPVSNEIAYMDAHQGEACIWVYSLADEAKRILAPVYESHYFMGHLVTKNFLWSPDGQKIAYVSTNQPEPSSEAGDVQVIARLLYKSRGGGGRPIITDEQLSHVYIVPAQGGPAQLITNSAYNEHSICWAPDSARIAFVSNRSADPDNNQLHDLWSVNISTLEVTRHTDNFGTVYQPTWSPDGNTIAFLGTKSKVATNDSPAEDTHLYVVSTVSASGDCLTRSFDRRIEQINWHPAGDYIYFTAGNEGTTAVYRVFVKEKSIEHIQGVNCQVLEYSLNKSGNELCFISTDSTHPAEIFLQNPGSGSARQLTNVSAELLNEFSFQPAVPLWFTSFDEKNIQGWLIKPADFKPAQKYPLILVIHGGPHNMFGFAFEDRMQLLAAKGYGVLYINPRGSSGYGQAFSSGCVLNWGGGDYKDLMAGVDAAIEENSWIDQDRLAVTGQSYGGYMTNWIITQTHRFKAAVSDGGISNLVSFAGTSLYHSLIESEFNGSAYDNFPLLWQCSPLRNIKNVKTPTLLLHGEQDNEVPVSQAEEMYIGLRKIGVETSLVQYRGEGHGWRPDLKPKNRQDVLMRTINWFDKYLAQ